MKVAGTPLLVNTTACTDNDGGGFVLKWGDNEIGRKV